MKKAIQKQAKPIAATGAAAIAAHKVSKYDPFSLAIISIIVIVFAILFIHKQRKNAGYIGAAGAASLYFAFIGIANNGRIIRNRSKKSFLVKPESSDQPYLVSPEQEVPFAIDGIAINGKIYKIPDGARIIITENGAIKYSTLVNEYASKQANAGEINNLDNFLQKNTNWKPLYEAMKNS